MSCNIFLLTTTCRCLHDFSLCVENPVRQEDWGVGTRAWKHVRYSDLLQWLGGYRISTSPPDSRSWRSRHTRGQRRKRHNLSSCVLNCGQPIQEDEVVVTNSDVTEGSHYLFPSILFSCIFTLSQHSNITSRCASVARCNCKASRSPQYATSHQATPSRNA